jgi:hypothetical protein
MVEVSRLIKPDMIIKIEADAIAVGDLRLHGDVFV